MGIWSPGPAATSGDDTYTGDATNETIDGLGGNDNIDAAAGDDTIIYRNGDGDLGEVLNGGADTDTLQLDSISTNDTFDLRRISIASFERLVLSQNAPGFTQNTVRLLSTAIGPGLSSTAEIVGSSGLDTIDIAMVTGGAFSVNFTLTNWDDSDTIYVSGTSDNDTITGSNRHDLLQGVDGNDTLNGGGGNDTLMGQSGDDVMNGGDGNDFLIDDGGINVMNGGDGDDVLVLFPAEGGQVGNEAHGGAGTDELGIASAPDTVFDFRNVVLSGSESFRMSGGTVQFSASQIATAFTSNLSLNSSAFASVDVLQIFATSSTTLSLAGWTFFQWTAIDRIEIFGSSGIDTIVGSSKNDWITGGGGNDTLNGGDGIDTAIFNVDISTASWQRNGVSIVVTSAEGTDSLFNVERLAFNDGRSVVFDTHVRQTFSDDGLSDVFLRRDDGVTAIWQLDHATVTDASVTDWQAGNEWDFAGIGDFNGDGRDDFLLRRVSDGVTTIWQMSGATVGASDVTQWQAGTEWSIAGTGDFNGDGKDDILWRRGSDGVLAIWNMNGFNVASADVTSQQAGANWHVELVGDFDGDGKDDLLIRRDDGVTAIWRMNGTSVINASLTSQLAGNEWDFAAAGDFNGDGRDDLILRRTDGVTVIWTMDASNVLSATLTSQLAGPEWHVAQVGDYNGDGRDDLFLVNDGGATAVWLMNGAVVTAAELTSQQAGTEWGFI